MGKKVFVNGDPLLASELNEYLMAQSVMAFSDATARDAAIEVPIYGQTAYLNNFQQLTIYNDAAWVPISLRSWVSYTPTLTNFTVGNGSFSAAYTQIGSTVHVRFKFTYGSTSAASGAFTASLPVAPSTNALGHGLIQDASGSDYPAQVFTSGSTFTMRISTASGSYATWAAASNTVPVAPANGDIYTAYITYQVAL